PGRTSKTELSSSRAAFSSIIPLVTLYTCDKIPADTIAITVNTTTMRTDSLTSLHPLAINARTRPAIQQRCYSIHNQNGKCNSFWIASPQSNQHNDQTNTNSKNPPTNRCHW